MGLEVFLALTTPCYLLGNPFATYKEVIPRPKTYSTETRHSMAEIG